MVEDLLEQLKDRVKEDIWLSASAGYCYYCNNEAAGMVLLSLKNEPEPVCLDHFKQSVEKGYYAALYRSAREDEELVELMKKHPCVDNASEAVDVLYDLALEQEDLEDEDEF